MLRQFGVCSLRLPTFKWIFNNFPHRSFILYKQTHTHTHTQLFMEAYISSEFFFFFYFVGRAQQAISSWAQALSACLTDRGAKLWEADNGREGRMAGKNGGVGAVRSRNRELRSFKSMPKKYHLCKSNKWQTALDSTRTAEWERKREVAERERKIGVEANRRHQKGGLTRQLARVKWEWVTNFIIKQVWQAKDELAERNNTLWKWKSNEKVIMKFCKRRSRRF